MSTPDYAKLLGAEIHGYLAYNASFMPEDPSLKNIRVAYLAFCQAIQPPLPDITFSDAKIAGVPTRRYAGKASNALVVYFHGGGFYRLAPEHPYPAHFDDALKVVDALDEKTILAGDSAGATLAASVALKRREKIHGHMLIYPWLDIPGEHESYRTHAEAPALTAQALVDFEALRLSGQPRPKTPDYFPLMGDDFNDLPPSYISTADCDPLCDEGTLYNTLHIFSGGESVLMEESGLMHGHLHARHHSLRAMEAFEHICEGLRNLAAWEKPPF